MDRYGCIIPVAGMSSRMGAFKPLLKVDHLTMIEHTINSALMAGVHKCVVILGYKGDEIAKCISYYDRDQVICLHNPDFENTDMLFSVKLGLKKMVEYQKKATFILPGDMPGISYQTFQILAAHMENDQTRVVFPLYQGIKTHPPLISQHYYEEIIAFDQPGGVRRALEQYEEEAVCVEIDDYGCCLDADTKQAFDQVKQYHLHKSK